MREHRWQGGQVSRVRDAGNSPLDPRFRSRVYAQIYEGALSVARHQQPAIAAHAEDIAMGIVERFAQRNMTVEVANPAAWGAIHARYACMNFAARDLARARREAVDDEAFWDEQVAADPRIYPERAVVGADAVDFALACLSDRERELVHLVEAGYSHAQVATLMGYAGPRSVTTTLSRIRGKVLSHVGGQEHLDELLG